MVLEELQFERQCNPVDMVEHVAHANDWEFQREGEDEINLAISGMWTDYSVSFSWMEDFEALHLACAFDLKIPQRCRADVSELLSLINEQLLIGHFDLWSGESVVMYRQALLLNGGAEPNDEQLQCLLVSALEACERYFQAFQFVLWAGHSPRQALNAAVFETHGSA